MADLNLNQIELRIGIGRDIVSKVLADEHHNAPACTGGRVLLVSVVPFLYVEDVHVKGGIVVKKVGKRQVQDVGG